jgi:hypothetical protein
MRFCCNKLFCYLIGNARGTEKVNFRSQNNPVRLNQSSGRSLHEITEACDGADCHKQMKEKHISRQ